MLPTQVTPRRDAPLPGPVLDVAWPITAQDIAQPLPSNVASVAAPSTGTATNQGTDSDSGPIIAEQESITKRSENYI